MSRISCAELSKYLLQGQLSRTQCLAVRRPLRRPHDRRGAVPVMHSAGGYHTSRPALSTKTTSGPSSDVPLRKQLKDEAKLARKQGKKSKSKKDSQTVDGWELTVGIEIHAQLNTARKLFSPALTSFNDEPNTHVAPFDLAMPGSQPLFQKETLVPALRAALALNCEIQPVSRFDRKHYFWWDQPAGYQITQYYEPFAKNGHVTLLARDGISPQDGESVTVGIKQVQLEQDTAKTLAQEGGTHWLDFNRVGSPLVEIITEPEMHHPRTAAVFVRKVQMLLNAMDACVSGMETGGMRADVNVSVRRADDPSAPLGTRTEIKNLSTIKAIEDAIISERDRQIRELQAGGVILGETRGWSVGSTETRRLRGKEGEVDYRYMPDPDIQPLMIGRDLVEHLRDHEGGVVSPDSEIDALISTYGLTAKDALSLLNLDNGARVEYFYKVVGKLKALLAANEDSSAHDLWEGYVLAGNWIVHELGRLTTSKAGPDVSGELTFSENREGVECDQVPSDELAQLLYHLLLREITGKVAKELLLGLYLGTFTKGVSQTIEDHQLWFHELAESDYHQIVSEVLEQHGQLLRDFAHKPEVPQGKIMYLLGQVLRSGPTELMDPKNAEAMLRKLIDESREGSA